MTGRTSHTIG